MSLKKVDQYNIVISLESLEIDFPADARPKSIDVYKKLLDNIKPSTQHVYCFVKLRGDPASLGLRSSNLWIYPHGDYGTLEEEFLKDPLEAPMPMFMGFSCMKDPEWNDNYPGVSNAIILTLAKGNRLFKRGGTVL